jgi:hypothetical protein
MNISDAQASGFRQVLTAMGAVLAGLGIKGLTAESAASAANDLAVILPAAVSLGSVIWSIVVAYGKKKVPIESTAIVLPEVLKETAKVGEHVDLTNVSTAKVVG